jgi:hypothetical protein
MIVPTMQVEIDLFSGRPNPAWELTAAEVSELKARLATLPTGSPVAMPEVLGYRGLHIAPLPGRQGINEPSSANTIIDVQVGGGAINAVRYNGTALHLVDTSQSLECWLLTIAQGRVEESIRQTALANLDSPCPQAPE